MFHWNWIVFVLVLLALFALSMIILGILTSYFGTGRSRAVGIILLVIGIIFGLFVIFGSYDVFRVSFVYSVLEPTVFYLIASIIGILIALLIFLGAIMKT
ncbi:hypothetical protein [Picrophilus oshimae]|uniref:Hypothetical membrane associated protein n=1 Tax=Picrophilus torridus (strain ATCC 700027 / DSM 9790 / JCM 10055 / NBRC 100828 / KAW 2/3) TaxID=1122961 RepID=Q6L1Q2_PICTO|nr:hypothetical protein [Picrophilus oshimae]AAT43100.1 hypothetical membrane associated protein [Picrophilus oshimae DSM 9789]SMD30592.1 hypothetical protein SAMN02745355_0481 [Picrophilus oshimae DSM 9789]